VLAEILRVDMKAYLIRWSLRWNLFGDLLMMFGQYGLQKRAKLITCNYSFLWQMAPRGA
jgi:hypothetical protein